MKAIDNSYLYSVFGEKPMPLQMFFSPLKSKKNFLISLRRMFMKQQTWVTSIEMYGQLLQFFGDGTVKRKKMG